MGVRDSLSLPIQILYNDVYGYTAYVKILFVSSQKKNCLKKINIKLIQKNLKTKMFKIKSLS